MATNTIGMGGIGLRFLFALALVCLTWNPTRFNYVEWTLAQYKTVGPLVAFAGIVLLMGWIFFVRTTARSLGVLGIVLCTGLAVVVLWILFFYNVVSTASTQLIEWIVLVLLSAILAAGMSWAHIRARWSGQATVDEVDHHR
ncbi:MAG TPA: DUF6524 family protein [Gammaproteobacteria bacterium]|nr:DUF6524 family protein [Gammaproteobacteria bacterium]